ncbi:MAG: hypothetical protein AAF698_11900 [Pseudomonadota bacterium]
MAAQTADNTGGSGTAAHEAVSPPIDPAVTEMMDSGPIMFGLDQNDLIFVFVLGMFIVGVASMLLKRYRGDK